MPAGLSAETRTPASITARLTTGINPHSGNYDFYGHTGSLGTLTQNVLLTGVPGITSAVIDSGLATADVGFWEQGLNQGNPSDDAQVMLTFRDGASSVIGSVSTPEVDSHDGSWEQYTGSFAIPVGTRSIDFTIEFIRHRFTDNDSFVDDTSLIVISSVPEPSGFVMMAAGTAAFLILRISRRRNPPAM